MGFKVGDKVTGKGKGASFAYNWTDSDAVMEVISIDGDGMVVEVLSHTRRKDVIGNSTLVIQEYFKLIKVELENK